MIETEHRRAAASNADQWLADLAPAGGNRDVYAERRETKAYATAGASRSREANMTDRYDRNGHEAGGHPEATSRPSHAYQDDYYDDHEVATRPAKAYVFDDEREEQGPEWTYDEQREIWVDRYGNPYVEAYPEGEEDRYAPAAEDEYLAPRAQPRPPRRKSRGSTVSLAALVLVASIGGGLAYVWKKGGFIGSDIPGIGSAPPVIKANSEPVKIKPAETAAVASQPTTREIFNRGNQTASVANERLVRHEEQPVAVVPTRPEGAAAPAVPDANATRPVTTSNITLPNPEGTAASDQTASSGTDAQVAATPNEPRRVKTIKIMPDNSVVTGDAPITPEPAAPQTRSVDVSALTPTPPAEQPAPVAPPAPAAAAQPEPAAPASAHSAAPVTTSPVATLPAGAATPAPEEQSGTAALPGEEESGATTVVQPTQTQATPPAIPPVRPRHIPTKPPAQVASAEPTPAPAEVAAPVSNGGYVVQVSSQRSPADAQAAFQSLQRRFGSVLGGMKASVRKVELPDRGTYYRVRVGGWSTPAEATAFCGKLKAAGGDCVIARN
ncbi:SPOR domain-containing protein [Labrys neptuniae]